MEPTLALFLTDAVGKTFQANLDYRTPARVVKLGHPWNSFYNQIRAASSYQSL